MYSKEQHVAFCKEHGFDRHDPERRTITMDIARRYVRRFGGYTDWGYEYDTGGRYPSLVNKDWEEVATVPYGVFEIIGQ